MKILSVCCSQCQNYFAYEAGSFEDLRGNVCDDCIEEREQQESCSHAHVRCIDGNPYEYYRCEDCGFVEAA